VFIGSSEFGLKSLQKLRRKFKVSGVITETNDPCGDYAKTHGIPALRMAEHHRTLEGRLKTRFTDFIDRRNPDAIAMCVWEKMIPPETVAKYRGMIFNFHASANEFFRGWAPVNWALYYGNVRVGMSVRVVTENFDCGPIVDPPQWLSVGVDATAGEVYDQMAPYAAEMLYDVLVRVDKGEELVLIEQPQEKVYPDAHEPETWETCIPWNNMGPTHVKNMVRAWNPMQYAWTTVPESLVDGEFIEDQHLKIARVEVRTSPAMKKGARPNDHPGVVFDVQSQRFGVECRSGSVYVTEALDSNETPYDMKDLTARLKGGEPVILGG